MKHIKQTTKNHTFLLIILLISVISCNHKKEDAKADQNYSKVEKKAVKRVYGYREDSVQIIKNTIKQNQTLSDILSQYRISYQTIHQIALASEEIYSLKKLSSNKKYELICSIDSVPQAKCFIYHPNPIDYIVFKFDDSIKISKEKFEVSKVTKTTSGFINSSLYNSLIRNGNSPKLAVKLLEIYAWQIDFLDIKKGDNFKIVYDELYVNDEFVGIGEIKASSFNHMGSNYFAFQHKQDSITEYYDEKGNSLRKAFLKAPLSYRRISSKFSRNRMHPILKRRMPHLGIDYAASKGTPVYSIGDGKVIKANYAGAAGNYVKIKHNGEYTTGYMHLLKFENGIRPGTYVKQGQLIGYVGSTGRSTGPHLDFRIWKNGVAIDPLSLKPPSAKPIDTKYKDNYFEKIKAYKNELNKIKVNSI